jgi:GxxExxY protein
MMSKLTAESTESAEMSQKDRLSKITETIIGCAINVHKELGPGLLESAYEACLLYDLSQTKMKIENQKPLPIIYKNVKLNCGYRLDLIIEDEVIVEIKSVEKMLPIHKAQLLSYLKISGLKVGLLINFNVELLKDGIIRVVNNYPDSLRTQRSQR